MNIGINALFLQFPATGTGQYLLHLLAALAEINQNDEYTLYGPKPLPGSAGLPLPFPYRIQPVPAVAARSKNIEKLVWEQFTVPAAAQRAGVDLLHVPYFAPPLLSRTPTVVTIHDAIQFRLPAYQPNGRVKAYMNLVRQAAHRAALIITVSEHAKRDISETMKIPAERIRVIYEAAGAEYHPVTDATQLAQTRQRYGLRERYVFYLGGLDQRKNVPQLVRAFANLYKRLDDPQLQLLIAGNPEKQQGPLFPDPRPIGDELGVSDQIVYRYVEEEDKPALYSGASVFVFPSLYEGFGLPPLEAMSCGAPVICSNRTSLPEVVGDAALLVDPGRGEELVDALYRVLTDEGLRADLSARSLQRAAHFSWRKTAQETRAVYEGALSRGAVIIKEK